MWSFVYHEPSTAQLLILISFFYLLNLFGWIAQSLLSAGLLGQILLGIIYGTPLAGWLLESWEDALVGIGYVGLLLLVFEGGMTSSLSNLTSLLLISTVIALTGLLVPIALSFILMPLGSFPALHAFAAGSALSSTSLGTVLTLLKPASLGFDLRKTRLGTALLSAAVMDDVVAFILVKVIGQIGNNTGASSSSALGSSIGRTIGVTIGLGVVVIPLSKYVFKPLYARLGRMSWWKSETLGWGRPFLIMIMTVWFIGMVAASGYAGTSPLYGSYVGGLVVAHVAEVDEPAGDHTDQAILMEDATTRSDNHPSGSFARDVESECTLSRRTTYTMPDSRPPSPPQPAYHGPQRASPASTLPPPIATPHVDGPEAVPEHDHGFVGAFEKYITPLLAYFLLPVFFGSIGYCIPFIPLWRGRIIWRGIVYAILMILGKMFCGLWLIVWASKSSGGALGSSPQSGDIDLAVGSDERLAETGKTGKAKWIGLKASAMLGMAMIARGEIGLLISQVARNTDTPLLDEDEFLIVTWAIVLCTIIGPVGVGIGVKRWGKSMLEGGWH